MLYHFISIENKITELFQQKIVLQYVYIYVYIYIPIFYPCMYF